jgi:hypothetical protein
MTSEQYGPGAAGTATEAGIECGDRYLDTTQAIKQPVANCAQGQLLEDQKSAVLTLP